MIVGPPPTAPWDELRFFVLFVLELHVLCFL